MFWWQKSVERLKKNLSYTSAAVNDIFVFNRTIKDWIPITQKLADVPMQRKKMESLRRQRWGQTTNIFLSEKVFLTFGSCE